MNVSGCMYVNRDSMQVRQALEGMRRTLVPLYEKIKHDKRHFVFKEELELISQRNFDGWGMMNIEELEVPNYMEPTRRRPHSPSWLKKRGAGPLAGSTDCVDVDPFGPSPVDVLTRD